MGAFDAALVTGGGSGIGRALAILLAGSGTRVTIVGRRAEALDETRRLANERGLDGITAVAADVSTIAGREEIATSFATEQFRIDKSAEKVCLVHNAAVTGDLATIDGLDPERFRATMATNVEGPLFLTQQMLPRMAEGSRVLHLSSGSAHRGTAGMIPYCASKAALFSVDEGLQDELSEYGIAVGSAMPGVVDTPMQAGLAATAPSWPMHAYFAALHAATAKQPSARSARPAWPWQQAAPAEPEAEVGWPPPTEGLDSPDNVARFLLWLPTDTSDDEFASQDWNIADWRHHSRWCGR